MKYLLPLILGFLLACAGALNSLTPEMPFQLPGDTNTTNVSVNTTNGQSTTQVSFTTSSVDETDLQGSLHEELKAAGWTVNSTTSGDARMLTCTKDGETLNISIRPGTGGGADFDVTWLQ